NASKIASGPLVAVSANSPFLFGKDLWAETRIPLFEQAVSVNEWDYSERVTFGVSYLVQSLEECFLSNIQRYPVLLPRLSDDPAARLNHVRLHNGTIWRWNRPLIGYEADGRPHLRIENRVVPAGPTMIDNVANAALYYGVTAALAHQKEPPELDILFSQARDNFYAAARLGLDADFEWFEGRKRKVRDLILEEIL
ncbi:MAG: glutamate--cysteine ligase, partial [Gammaproteobacteria bacterium]|nr:glutamate--cysteine ligase [Gammaproteobacteria bacterium]